MVKLISEGEGLARMPRFSDQNLARGILIPLAFIAAMWLVKLVEYSAGIELYTWGLHPRKLSGLTGVILAPLLHGDLNHLLSNTLPILVLGFAILNGFPRISLRVFSWIYLLTGLWVWIAARPVYHIGASGIIYGMAFFLLAMGIFTRDRRAMALSMLVVFFYGGLFWGLLPTEDRISWESHLIGAIAGIFTAWIYHKGVREELARNRPVVADHPLPYWKYEVEGDLKPEYRNETAPGWEYHYEFIPGGKQPEETPDEKPPGQ
jgi:membrane associated rhomboid family serine protease